MTLTAARENMVDSQVRTSDVSDPALQAAMRRVRREDFCAPGRADLAYAELDLEIAPGRFLLQPRDAAKLLQALQPRARERALVICEPYVAAVLAEVGCETTAVDGAAASATVRHALEQTGVAVLTGEPGSLDVDGPFDVIVGGGAVAETPAGWLERLADGGRAGVIVRKGRQGRAMLFVRSGDATSGRAVFDATPPWLPGLEAKVGFAF